MNRRSPRRWGLVLALALMWIPSAVLVGLGPGPAQSVSLGLVAAGMVLALLVG